MKHIIQIAGIHDLREAQMCIEAGVAHIGFPLRLDVHSEDIHEDVAAKIIRSFNSSVTGVLITYLKRPMEILELCRKLGVRWVQLHSNISVDNIKKLKSLDPDLRIVKGLIVYEDNQDDLLSIVDEYSPYIDAFITDTYDLETGACGATGKTHNWEISRKIVKISPNPVILAGGLNCENVYDAILFVQPAGVDVHTGVEGTDGRKNPDLVNHFVTAAKHAFDKIDIIIQDKAKAKA